MAGSSRNRRLTRIPGTSFGLGAPGVSVSYGHEPANYAYVGAGTDANKYESAEGVIDAGVIGVHAIIRVLDTVESLGVVVRAGRADPEPRQGLELRYDSTSVYALFWATDTSSNESARFDIVPISIGDLLVVSSWWDPDLDLIRIVVNGVEIGHGVDMTGKTFDPPGAEAKVTLGDYPDAAGFNSDDFGVVSVRLFDTVPDVAYVEAMQLGLMSGVHPTLPIYPTGTKHAFDAFNALSSVGPRAVLHDQVGAAHLTRNGAIDVLLLDPVVWFDFLGWEMANASSIAYYAGPAGEPDTDAIGFSVILRVRTTPIAGEEIPFACENSAPSPQGFWLDLLWTGATGEPLASGFWLTSTDYVRGAAFDIAELATGGVIVFTSWIDEATKKVHTIANGVELATIDYTGSTYAAVAANTRISIGTLVRSPALAPMDAHLSFVSGSIFETAPDPADIVAMQQELLADTRTVSLPAHVGEVHGYDGDEIAGGGPVWPDRTGSADLDRVGTTVSFMNALRAPLAWPEPLYFALVSNLTTRYFRGTAGELASDLKVAHFILRKNAATISTQQIIGGFEDGSEGFYVEALSGDLVRLVTQVDGGPVEVVGPVSISRFTTGDIILVSLWIDADGTTTHVVLQGEEVYPADLSLAQKPPDSGAAPNLGIFRTSVLPLIDVGLVECILCSTAPTVATVQAAHAALITSGVLEFVAQTDEEHRHAAATFAGVGLGGLAGAGQAWGDETGAADADPTGNPIIRPYFALSMPEIANWELTNTTVSDAYLGAADDHSNPLGFHAVLRKLSASAGQHTWCSVSTNINTNGLFCDLYIDAVRIVVRTAGGVKVHSFSLAGIDLGDAFVVSGWVDATGGVLRLVFQGAEVASPPALGGAYTVPGAGAQISLGKYPLTGIPLGTKGGLLSCVLLSAPPTDVDEAIAVHAAVLSDEALEIPDGVTGEAHRYRFADAAGPRAVLSDLGPGGADLTRLGTASNIVLPIKAPLVVG